MLAVLTIGAEIAVFFAYRDTVDGQSVFAGAAILLYALVAIALVWVIAAAIQRRRRRDIANPS